MRENEDVDWAYDFDIFAVEAKLPQGYELNHLCDFLCETSSRTSNPTLSGDRETAVFVAVIGRHLLMVRHGDDALHPPCSLLVPL